MGRDKNNSKPLDAAAFGTLVKTTSEVLRRHEQHLHTMPHKRLAISTETGLIEVAQGMVPDENDPNALLSAQNETGEQLAQVRVGPGFKFNRQSATAWIESGLVQPGA